MADPLSVIHNFPKTTATKKRTFILADNVLETSLVLLCASKDLGDNRIFTFGPSNKGLIELAQMGRGTYNCTHEGDTELNSKVI